MLRQSFLFWILLLPCWVFAQKTAIKGTITDATTGETLIGANVLAADGVGAITDFDGNYSFQVPNGSYTLKISYVGYETVEREVTATGKVLVVNVALETSTLDEIKVVADVARDRETPVAFTNVLPVKIEEELASQDLPMVLNSTPGVYATQQGGGDGDARITIRGFNQRNVAVMIDGIPVNDMENGWVYWSNWFGLDMVTRSMQVQRGLGASKVAIPSVGGTINILTKGIETGKFFTFKQEFGTNGFLRSSLAYSSGRLDNGWGVTAAVSRKQGNGWVDQAFTEGKFWYLKVQKEIGKNHLLSISGMGAPQSHGQRSFKKSIATYSKDYAAELGIDTTGLMERGLQYNEHWGYIERFKIIDGDTVHAKPVILNERINYFHKPQFSLRHFWTINDKVSLSNVAYLSIGNGGGTAIDPSVGNADRTEEGQINFQKFYNSTFGPFAIDTRYSLTERKTGKIIRSSYNNHWWYGLLSTVSYNINPLFDFSGGLDFRSYKGEHYRTVYDLLGGDYFVNIADKNSTNPVKRVGDKFDYYNDGLVRWAGAFGQLEFQTGNWSAFINLSGAYSGYKRIDYFRKKQIEVGDTTLNVGYTYVNGIAVPDSITYDGVLYTPESEGLKHNQTDWFWKPGFTIKGGANYNINDHHNVFMNLGYLSRAPRFNNVFNNENKLFLEINSELIKAIELGYGMNYHKFAMNVNGYYTTWENKPVDFAISIPDLVTGENIPANVNGIDALHMGLEVDFSYDITKQLNFQGLASIGDWTYQSAETVEYFHPNTGQKLGEVSFDAKGVHVGDAAQTQFAGALRYEPCKGFYTKLQYTHFLRQYADFQPVDLQGDFARRESWMMPAYYLFDLHAGYKFKISDVQFQVSGSILNLLDEVYISDATNNDTYLEMPSKDFDAKSAGVFFGQGRRYNVSLKISIF